jgi:ATP-dependent Clp protease adaptor protein ClpS
MPIEQVETRDKVELVFPNRYNVLLLNDDYTPMDFVIQLLVEVFNRSLDEATTITMKVHDEGQGIAGTYSHEVAEQKQTESSMISRHNGHPLKIVLEKLE